MDELKRCPFCGGEASLDEIPPTPFLDEYSTYYSVGCKECNIGWYEESREQAIAVWNRRGYSLRHNPKPLTLEELRERIGKPVWIEVKNEAEYCEPSYWAIVGSEWDNGEGIALDDAYTGDGAAYYLYDKTWLAYDYPPEDKA